MGNAHAAEPELPNLISFLAAKFNIAFLAEHIHFWEYVIFSLITVAVISLLAFFASRRSSFIPENRLQTAVELIAGGLDDFICGIIGPRGRKFTPFIGTLFIYILFMNLFGLIPFMKSSTSSLSTTFALAICVFLYVQYTAFKELGFLGYLDHMSGKPRGMLAFSVFIPLMMFILHIVSELVRPVSLALRLRSNVWGDDMLMAVVAGFGIKGVPMLVFSTFLTIISSIVQAVVFCLLSTIYLALVMPHEEEIA